MSSNDYYDMKVMTSNDQLGMKNPAILFEDCFISLKVS